MTPDGGRYEPTGHDHRTRVRAQARAPLHSPLQSPSLSPAPHHSHSRRPPYPCPCPCPYHPEGLQCPDRSQKHQRNRQSRIPQTQKRRLRPGLSDFDDQG